jgi:ABC-type transporter Mla subunit MlaD
MIGEDSTGRNARQRRRPLIGGAIVGALLAAAMLIFFLEDILNAFERRYEIVALLPDAPGLVPGSPVWVGGKVVGEVLDVGFMPSGADSLDRVRLTLRLPRRVQDQVRRDSQLRVTAASLMGEQVVAVTPGTAAAAVLREGDTLRLQKRPTGAELASRAAAVKQDFDAVMVELQALGPVVNARMAEAQRAFAGMDAAIAEAGRIGADLGRNQGLALVQDPAFSASLARARESVAALPASFATLRERAGPGGELGPALAQLQARADTLRAQLDAAAALLEQPDGFPGRFRSDPALLNAVHAARASLDSLVAEVSRNPLRFVF